MRTLLWIGVGGLISGLTVVEAASAQEFCADPAKSCRDGLSQSCLGRVGAGSLAVGVAPSDATADCAAEFDAYRACLSRAAAECGAARRPETAPRQAAGGDATMLAIWNEIKDSGDAAALESFADSYDGNPLAALARSRAAALRSDAAAPAPAPNPGADAEDQENAQKLMELATQLGERLKAAQTPTGEGGLEILLAEVHGILQDFSACTESTGDAASAAVIDQVFLEDLEDPQISAKLSDPTPFSDEILVHLVRSSAGEAACVASMVERMSVVTPEGLAAVAELFEEFEDLQLSALEERPSIGQVNTGFQSLLLNFQKNLLGALSITQIRLQMGAEAPDDTRVMIQDMLEAWADAREAYHDEFPTHLQVSPPEIVRCRWAGAVMRCVH